ncbi:RidA family protein [Pseudaestuariivita atlantica]|uniref:Endoribonuclease n=1 Tax=Pseudaestuariivita atlantica TaxID=1317121 RepID=A0A0L1JTG5_9RHOB|nr:RidA family protein [Pseudaestuariivita atlantica]KNG94708.1 endoribonuclease [Pseudaestuariivita atlantica]
MVDVVAKLAEMGLELPNASAPAANYVPFVQVGGTLYVSGQISLAADGSKIIGKVGADLSPEEGAEAARRCGLNLLAQVSAAIGGDWSRFRRAVKLTGFVNSTPDFEGQPAVINGCSDLMVDVLGDAGRHARSAVSAGALPLGVAVEIEGIFEIDAA